MTDSQAQALKMIAGAVLDAVKAAGDMGAPSGVIYAALMSYGISLEGYERLISAMIGAKLIRRSNHLLYVV